MKSKIAVFSFMIVCAIATLAPCAWSQAQTVEIGDSTFLIQYDTALLVAYCVQWILKGSDIGKSKREPAWKFTQDPRTNVRQATHDDYTHSGFDRGHLCPAADRSASTKLMKSTFVMTNVAPQTPALNRGAWKKIEDACRKYAAGGHYLKIQAFPVFWQADTQRIGRNRVAVPHGFVKTVRLAENDSIIFTRYFSNQ